MPSVYQIKLSGATPRAVRLALGPGFAAQRSLHVLADSIEEMEDT